MLKLNEEISIYMKHLETIAAQENDLKDIKDSFNDIRNSLILFILLTAILFAASLYIAASITCIATIIFAIDFRFHKQKLYIAETTLESMHTIKHAFLIQHRDEKIMYTLREQQPTK